jgi:ribosomal protein L37AE/L43A
MATYNQFELEAMSAPEDAYGYRARAAREGRDYDARRAPERNDCGACPAHPETLVYNAADRIWVCAECDLAINEAVRLQMQALASSPLAECAECGSTRKTVATDRELLDAAAVCCQGRAA